MLYIGHIRDELILEVHLDADTSHILLSCAGESDEVRYLADALCSMAAEMAGTRRRSWHRYTCCWPSWRRGEKS